MFKIKLPKPSLLLGILLTVFAGSLLAVMDAISKYLTGSFEVVQVLWSRYFFHAVIVFAYLLLTRSRSVYKSVRLNIQLQRSFTLFAATIAMYTSLKYLPLADAAAVQHAFPVIVTIFSAIFLGEKIGAHRFLAILAGFCGVLVLIQPGANFQWPILLPLITALMLAVFLIQTRQLQGYDDAYTTLFYSTLVGVVVLSLVVPFFWQQPTFNEFLLMCAQGSLGAFGHLMLIKGFKYATASVLSPFLYSQLLVAVIISVVYFADPLTVAMMAGACLIVASGIYIWYRETYVKRKEVP